MIEFELNGRRGRLFGGDEKLSLLDYLRGEAGIFSAKDGCSGQGACGACLVELNGRPALACVTPMKKVGGGRVVTLEGLPERLRRALGDAFVAKGAVQCGFCTPGFLMRTKILLQDNPRPSRPEILAALKLNLCRCTGYVKIVEAIEQAAADTGRGKGRRRPTRTGASAAARKNTRPGRPRPAAGPSSPTCASPAWSSAP